MGEFWSVNSYQPYRTSGLLVDEFRHVNSINTMVYRAFGLLVGEFRHVNAASWLLVGEFWSINSYQPYLVFGLLVGELRIVI